MCLQEGCDYIWVTIEGDDCITNEEIENKSDDSNSNNSNETSDIHLDEFSEYSNNDDNDGNDGKIDDEFFNVFKDYSLPILDSPNISKLPKEE